jgi:hypothetical protein
VQEASIVLSFFEDIPFVGPVAGRSRPPSIPQIFNPKSALEIK